MTPIRNNSLAKISDSMNQISKGVYPVKPHLRVSGQHAFENLSDYYRSHTLEYKAEV